MQPKWWLIIFVVAIITLVSVVASGCGIEQKRSSSGLQITSVEATAAAYLNGSYLNKTPLIEKNLRPGTYTVRLVADDSSLTPFESQVDLNAGTLASVTWKPGLRPEYSSSVIYQLEPLETAAAWWMFWKNAGESAQTGELKIVTTPDNAIINLTDQHDRQFAPFVYTSLPAGEINYSVFLPSYETHQHTLTIKPGFRTTAIITLAKNPIEMDDGQRVEAATEEQILSVGNATSAALLKTASSSAQSTASAEASTSAKASASATAKPSP